MTTEHYVNSNLGLLLTRIFFLRVSASCLNCSNSDMFSVRPVKRDTPRCEKRSREKALGKALARGYGHLQFNGVYCKQLVALRNGCWGEKQRRTNGFTKWRREQEPWASAINRNPYLVTRKRRGYGRRGFGARAQIQCAFFLCVGEKYFTRYK